jgi:alpha-tubulin suppressor-like RCC1 family protein
VEDELDSVAARNYFNDFKLPLMTIPLKQIQSTFISKVACGLEHALLLTSSGFIYSMGQNTWGQLGGEQGIEQSSPEYPNESYNQGTSVENEKNGSYPP